MNRSIVLNGNILGVIFPFGENKFELQVLRSKQIRGEQLATMGTIPFDPEKDFFRDANEQDFHDFRVVPHPDYFRNFQDTRLKTA